MAAKTFLVLCAQAFLMQSVYSQCRGRIGAGPLGAGPIAGPRAGPLAGPLTAPIAAPALSGCGVTSTGGIFPVTSGSPIAPTGVSVVSENAIEGALSVGGNLPLLGSVTLEGAFSTAGAGAVSYGCGDGAVGIASEGPIATGIVGPTPARAPALAAPALTAPTLAAPALAAPGFAAPALTPGLFGARAGIAPATRCGCSRFF